MRKYQWQSITIRTNKQANEAIALFDKLQPLVGACDTEADGLHIVLNKPFVFQCGFLHPTLLKGYTYAIDIEKQPQLARAFINAWHIRAKTLKIYLGHNIKFDLHMLTNIDLAYTTENLSDTMFYIRYAHSFLTPENGGPPLGLKDYTTRYIDHNARDHDKLLQKERGQLAQEINVKLKMKLSKNLKVVEKLFKDVTMTYHELPEDIRSLYMDWLQHDVPIYLQNKIHGLVEKDDIPYNVLNRANLITYAHHDIIYTLEVYASLAPVVTARNNDVGIEFENKLIIPLYEMERVGFKADKNYIEQARLNVKAYIKSCREQLYSLVGTEFTIGQHALIKQVILAQFEIELPSTNAEVLDLFVSELTRTDPGHQVIQFISLLQELRTLEKWYATYIMRFIRDLRTTDRLYTTINQVGTVSGRVTSDFQQFPKNAISTRDGVELYHPRKMVLPTGGDYNAIIYLDYSQIELRFQAFYTILVGHPDLNLCRAYMPYQCVNIHGDLFDSSNLMHIRSWGSQWFLSENRSMVWTPTDVHGATTTQATGLTESDPAFKELRSSIGKRTNFAKNYGAKRQRIRQMFPEKTEAEITKIDDAYYLAFPGVKYYHQYCYSVAQEFDCVTNLFGINYYGVNGHKLINMLIQGSSAYYLKWKMRVLYDYCQANNIQSRYILNIHDELQYERHISDPPELFFEFKKIMEDWPDTQVPIVTDMEVTTTNWAEKKGVHNVNELQLHIGN